MTSDAEPEDRGWPGWGWGRSVPTQYWPCGGKSVCFG